MVPQELPALGVEEGISNKEEAEQAEEIGSSNKEEAEVAEEREDLLCQRSDESGPDILGTEYPAQIHSMTSSREFSPVWPQARRLALYFACAAASLVRVLSLSAEKMKGIGNA